MNTTTVDRRLGYSLEDDLMPIIRGEQRLPNFEEQDPGLVISNLAAVGHSLKPHWGWALLGPDWHRRWAFYFLNPVPTNRGGGYDGGGYVLIYRSHPLGLAGTFAICRHEKHGTGTADQSQRGWHPGHCAKCGMNMSVDSGD